MRVYALWLAPVGLLALAAITAALRWLAAQTARPAASPPSSLSPVEAGIVAEGRFRTDDLVASVVQLAVRGIIGLQQMANGDVLVTVRKVWQRESGLRASDIAMLARVYAHGDAVRPLSEFRSGPGELGETFDTLANAMVERGLYDGPPPTLRRVGRWTALAVAGAWIQIAWALHASASAYPPAFVTGAVIWILTDWISRHYLSASGKRARVELLGFRKFLRRPGRERLDRLPADAFHTFLPWAIALGASQAWIAHFAGRTVAPNDWYAAQTPVGVAQMNGVIANMRALLRPLRAPDPRATVKTARDPAQKRTTR